MENWDKGIQDIAYLLHLVMHAQWYGRPCQLCARYPLPDELQEGIGLKERKPMEAEVIEYEDDL